MKWHMTTDAIRVIAQEIQEDSQPAEVKERLYTEKYPVFFEHYNTLAKMCCDGKMDNTRLEFMLKMLDQVKTQKVSQEKASNVVGQELFDKFVAPKVKDMKFPEK